MTFELETKQTKVITCPYCGYQHLACEVMYPDDFAGKSTSVVRDPLGKVLYAEWDKEYEQEKVEHYFCDNCGQEFIVEPTISFKVSKVAEELNFSNTTVSLLD